MRNDRARNDADDVEELRERVRELEETLRAIQEGEVDGVLVKGQVYVLEGAEATYRVFLDQMADGAAVIDPTGRILFSNRRFAELLGTTTAVLIGDDVRSIPVAEVRDSLAAIRAPGEAGAHAICRFADESGRTRLMRVTATRADESGKLAVLLTDLTATYEKGLALEHRQARHRDGTDALAEMVAELRAARAAALNMMEDAAEAARAQEAAYRSLQAEVVARQLSEESARRLASVVEQAHDSIIITDAAGTIEYVNRSFERVTGYTAAEAVGRNPRLLKSGHQSEAFYRELWNCITSGQAWHGTLTNRRKDGQLFHEEGTIFPVRGSDGQITSFVAIKRDISDEIALRQQLVRSQRMEAIGTLAGGVAHDFNNILHAMGTLIELLRRKNSERCLDQLAAAVRRGSKLTAQLLLFARPEATVAFHAVDLNEILTGMHEFLRRVVRENIRLTVTPASGLLGIQANAGQIEQVIMNLAINAIDAMPDGGALSIVAHGEPDVVWLEVADSGTGIPEEIRHRIFDPFFTTKPAGKGTGLGLSVVHGIVKAHGGEIAVECPPGGGTRFAMRFPRHGEDIDGSSAAPAEMPFGHGERILVVEDEPTAREGLCGILELIGYAPTAASTGEEALALESEQPLDALLTDMTLPGISGIEVSRALRTRWPRLKIILMSGYAAPEVTQRSNGTCRYLQKPFDVSELARALSAALAAGSDDPAPF